VKSDILIWIASLPEDDLRLAKVDAIRRGDDSIAVGSMRTYSITEVAALTRRSRPTIYRIIKSGALPAAPLYPGGRPRVREADFRRWLENRGEKK
jgi:excisionase family DNA binding protein